jgi:hypothetical protein
MYAYMLDTFSFLPIPSSDLEYGLWRYLTTQLSWCNDANFSAQYPYIEMGLPQAFFQQKTIQVDGATYLTGPRYLAGDIRHPFIDLVASSAPLTAKAACEILCAWQPLHPLSLRSFARPAPHHAGILDQQIYGGPLHGDSAERDEVLLVHADISDLSWCMKTLEVSYRETHRRLPAITPQLKPATTEDLRNSLLNNNVFIIHHRNNAVGLIVCEEGLRAFLSGYWITEEVILPEYRGMGLAAAAQRELKRLLSRKLGAGALLGTIATGNTPSMKTAERAGRIPVLSYVFQTKAELNEWRDGTDEKNYFSQNGTTS